jgi:hypothetical protein
MADTRVEMAPEADIRAWLAAGVAELFEKRLGPDMTADAERACPKLTGRLAGSLDHDVQETADGLPVLIVGSFDDKSDEGRVPYAAAVEMGFHGEEEVRPYVTKTGRRVGAHTRQGNTPEQPYLRPALYRKRSG